MIVKYTNEEYEKAKSTDKLPLECEQCGNIFYAEKKQIKFELAHNRGRLKYCSPECSNKAHNKSHHLRCEKCGKDIVVPDSTYRKSTTKHFFCSNSCATKYNNELRNHVSEEQKKKVSETLLSRYSRLEKEGKFQRKIYKCIVCGNEYYFGKEGSTKNCCSKECSHEYRTNTKKYLSPEIIEKLRSGGQISATIQGDKKRSKNEMYFCELCEKRFNNVKHNERLFNGWDADVIIEDIKYAIMWNGIWHYKKITNSHSLEKTEERDKLKINEIKNCGYTPYIIKDMGRYNPKFVEDEFKKFVNIAG